MARGKEKDIASKLKRIANKEKGKNPNSTPTIRKRRKEQRVLR